MIYLWQTEAFVCRWFPKQIYVTLDYATAVHRKTSSRLFTHPLLHPRTQTHLVLLQGSFLLHVRAVFARDDSFDIGHRHCRTHRGDNSKNNNKVRALKCLIRISTLTFVLQRVVGHLPLGTLLQISIVQDFMVRRQAAVPELVFKKGNTSRVRAALRRRHGASNHREIWSRRKDTLTREARKTAVGKIYRWSAMLGMEGGILTFNKTGCWPPSFSYFFLSQQQQMPSVKFMRRDIQFFFSPKCISGP